MVKDFDAGFDEVLVLRPDRHIQRDGERKGGPVIRISSGYTRLGLVTKMLVLVGSPPVDRHDLQGGEQKCLVQFALDCESRQMARDLLSHHMRRYACPPICRRNYETGATADERGEQDVRVSDYGARRRNRRAPQTR